MRLVQEAACHCGEFWVPHLVPPWGGPGTMRLGRPDHDRCLDGSCTAVQLVVLEHVEPPVPKPHAFGFNVFWVLSAKHLFFALIFCWFSAGCKDLTDGKTQLHSTFLKHHGPRLLQFLEPNLGWRGQWQLVATLELYLFTWGEFIWRVNHPICGGMLEFKKEFSHVPTLATPHQLDRIEEERSAFITIVLRNNQVIFDHWRLKQPSYR